MKNIAWTRFEGVRKKKKNGDSSAGRTERKGEKTYWKTKSVSERMGKIKNAMDLNI